MTQRFAADAITHTLELLIAISASVNLRTAPLKAAVGATISGS